MKLAFEKEAFMYTPVKRRRKLIRFSRLRYGGADLNRTELVSQEEREFQCWKELDHWLLWAGISPDAQNPMSHIGIYTDFT